MECDSDPGELNGLNRSYSWKVDSFGRLLIAEEILHNRDRAWMNEYILY
jgi:hypothetical protein